MATKARCITFHGFRLNVEFTFAQLNVFTADGSHLIPTPHLVNYATPYECLAVYSKSSYNVFTSLGSLRNGFIRTWEGCMHPLWEAVTNHA